MRAHLVSSESLAAPGANNDVRVGINDRLRLGDDSVLALRHQAQLGEAIHPTSEADQFRYPAYREYHRRVPLLEVDAWSKPGR